MCEFSYEKLLRFSLEGGFKMVADDVYAAIVFGATKMLTFNLDVLQPANMEFCRK